MNKILKILLADVAVAVVSIAVVITINECTIHTALQNARVSLDKSSQIVDQRETDYKNRTGTKAALCLDFLAGTREKLTIGYRLMNESGRHQTWGVHDSTSKLLAVRANQIADEAKDALRKVCRSAS